MTERTIPSRTGGWGVPVALIALCAIPLAAGAFRLTELAGGTEVTPANARFFASPLPVALHIVSAGLYAILGAFQFVTGFRRRRPGWHRVAGRLLIACGLLVGLSGLWMTLFYPWPDGDGELLYALRLLFGSAMVVSIVLGFTAIRRGDVIRHRAWMMRGYAIGLGAGTQVLTLLAGGMIVGPPSELSRALLMGAGWVINLAVAEWAIRNRPATPPRTPRQPSVRRPRASFSGGNAFGAGARRLADGDRAPGATTAAACQERGTPITPVAARRGSCGPLSASSCQRYSTYL